MLFRTVPSPASPPHLRSPLPQDWGFATPPKTPIAIISGTDEKFGRNIHRVHPNKSPLKFWWTGSVGVSRDFPVFCVPPIIPGTGKATNFKFCTHIHSINRNKSPLKISGKVAVGVLRDSQIFPGHPYIWAHRAVIFAVAQLSCIWYSLL